MRILHAALPADWDRARADGQYDVSTRGRSLTEEGFVHGSTAAQLPGVLDAMYADVPSVVVLVLDLGVLDHEGADVEWEAVPGAPAEVGPFPHVYGVIPTQAVVAELPLTHEPGEPWQLPDLSSYDLATGP